MSMYSEEEKEKAYDAALERVEPSLPPPAIREAAERYAEITPAQARVESVAAVLDSAYRNASTLKLTPEEAQKLMEDFPDEAFRLGAGGDDRLLYLEHAYLRQRLNQVLGIGAVVPIRRREWAEEFTYFKDNRNKTGVRVYVDLVLIVRGCVVGEAIGDSAYYPDNAKTNYSDALESAKSNAFRRCAKEFGVGLQPWMKGFVEGWQYRQNQNRSQARQNTQQAPRPQPAPKPAPQANVERKPAASGDVLPKVASEARRKQVYDYLVGMFGPDDFNTFSDSKGWVNEWPLKDVPASNQDLSRLVQEINDFIAARQAPPTDASPQEEGASDLPPHIGETIISVPRKGMKRADYLANPDTIGSLYVAMKNGDNEAQKRLWGMAKNYTPESWVGNDGVKRAPSQADVDCRIGLDLFLEWHQQHGQGDEQ